MNQARAEPADVKQPNRPCVLALLYLPVAEPVMFGDWWLGPVGSFDGPWLSDEFQRVVKIFVGAFRDSHGQPFERPSVLVRQSTGADGARPSDPELKALRAAISFAVVHQNPYWSEGRRLDGHRISTSDNADLWVQPLDLDENDITIRRGSHAAELISTTLGSPIPAPLEVRAPEPPVSLDAELLDAVYGVLVHPPKGRESEARAIAVAIRWLAKSWRNTSSITWEDRLVFLKVATEALTGEDRNHESARRMVEIYRSARSQEGEELGAEALLWQPDEPMIRRTRTRRDGQQETVMISQFEHWARALGDARNSIVHGEETADHRYDETDSPYNGPFVATGDRVVRELITILLGELGYPYVWRNDRWRNELRALQSVQTLCADEQPT